MVEAKFEQILPRQHALRREEQLFSESQRASTQLNVLLFKSISQLNNTIKMKLATAALLAGSAAAFNVKEVRFFAAVESFFPQIAWGDNWRTHAVRVPVPGPTCDVGDLVRGKREFCHDWL